jgi:hypothetical protein
LDEGVTFWGVGASKGIWGGLAAVVEGFVEVRGMRVRGKRKNRQRQGPMRGAFAPLEDDGEEQATASTTTRSTASANADSLRE